MREPLRHDRSFAAAFPARDAAGCMAGDGDARAGGAPFAIGVLVTPWQPSRIGARRPVRDADAFARLGADRIDRALQASRVRATFVIDPLWAQRHATDALRIAARHEVAVLGYDARRPSSSDPARGAEALERLTGARPRFFLPARDAPCPPEAILAAGLRDARTLRLARIGRCERLGWRGLRIGPAVLALLPRSMVASALARDRAGCSAAVLVDASAAADLRGLAGAPLGGLGTGTAFASALAAIAELGES
jgi:hypothetical protein